MPLSDVTFLVVTNAIPSHPSTKIIDETLGSLQHQFQGSKSPWILANGNKPEFEYLITRYAEFKGLLRERWPECRVIEFGEHLHQVGMLRRVLPEIKTPLIAWIEHDWPLHLMPVPWEKIFQTLLTDEVKHIRFSSMKSAREAEGQFYRGEMTSTSGLQLAKTVQPFIPLGVGQTEFFKERAKLPGDKEFLESTDFRNLCERDNWNYWRLAIWPTNDIFCYSTDGRAQDFARNGYVGLAVSYAAGLSILVESGSLNGKGIRRQFFKNLPTNTVSFIRLTYNCEIVVDQNSFAGSGTKLLAEVITNSERVIQIKETRG